MTAAAAFWLILVPIFGAGLLWYQCWKMRVLAEREPRP